MLVGGGAVVVMALVAWGLAAGSRSGANKYSDAAAAAPLYRDEAPALRGESAPQGWGASPPTQGVLDSAGDGGATERCETQRDTAARAGRAPMRGIWADAPRRNRAAVAARFRDPTVGVEPQTSAQQREGGIIRSSAWDDEAQPARGTERRYDFEGTISRMPASGLLVRRGPRVRAGGARHPLPPLRRGGGGAAVADPAGERCS